MPIPIIYLPKSYLIHLQKKVISIISRLKPLPRHFINFWLFLYGSKLTIKNVQMLHTNIAKPYIGLSRRKRDSLEPSEVTEIIFSLPDFSIP